MVGTRTTKGGRLQGLPNIRHFRNDPPSESDEEAERGGAAAQRRGGGGRGGVKGGAARPSKPGKARAAAPKPDRGRITVLSDRRCVMSRGLRPGARRRRAAPRAPC
jgi:hypothetical protein